MISLVLAVMAAAVVAVATAAVVVTEAIALAVFTQHLSNVCAYAHIYRGVDFLIAIGKWFL